MNVATRITVFRIILVPLFIACLLYYRPERDGLRFAALAIFLVGAVSDAVDGFIARTQHQHSRLGIVLDPLADKLMLMTAFVALSTLEQLPPSLKIAPWITLTVISRDVLIILGSVLIYYLTGSLEIRPSALGKVTTALQMAAVLMVLLGWPGAGWWAVAAAILTVLSGIGYLRYGTRLLNGSAGEPAS
ncbi:MAG: CDP-alcohol phosphatidyltransferase family protein [Candidatus Omnitrophica bacterium]|nr:CDP-alcohol phosphatidyltransferase family protein [Candidatus Omnitrophota bacterium]